MGSQCCSRGQQHPRSPVHKWQLLKLKYHPVTVQLDLVPVMDLRNRGAFEGGWRWLSSLRAVLPSEGWSLLPDMWGS